jgi:hypothetical protein
LGRIRAYLFRQIMRADVDGCDVFASFAFVDVDAEGLGGTAFSEGSAPFWLLFFFFAIIRNVLRVMNICNRAGSECDRLLA